MKIISNNSSFRDLFFNHSFRNNSFFKFIVSRNIAKSFFSDCFSRPLFLKLFKFFKIRLKVLWILQNSFRLNSINNSRILFCPSSFYYQSSINLINILPLSSTIFSHLIFLTLPRRNHWKINILPLIQSYLLQVIISNKTIHRWVTLEWTTI